MKNDNFYKTLRIVCLILAIVCMALSLFKKVKAEEMDHTLYSEVKDIFDQYFNGYTELQLQQFTSNNPYVCIYDVTVEGTDLLIADFFNTKQIGLNCVFINNYYYTSGYTGYADNMKDYLVANTSNTDFTVNLGTFYRCIARKSTNKLESIYEYPIVDSEVKYDDVWYSNRYFIARGRNTIFQNNSFSDSSYSVSSTPMLSYGEYYQNYGNNSFRLIEDTFTPITNNTNGFNVFKYNNLGVDTLRIVPPQNLVTVGTHTSNVSTVTFDLVIDDTTIPCEYNSESDYYYESIEYSRAYYEIPLSVLLPSSLNDFDNVYVTNVNYVNTWSNQGGESGSNTFIYVDKCYLKRTVNNEDIGQVTITHVDTDTGYTDIQVNDIYTMITNASTLQGSFNVDKNLSGGSSTPFSFSSFQDAVVREIECWHPTGTKDSDWLSITIDNITYNSGDNMYWLEYDSNSTQSFEHRYNYNVSPYSYIRENNYAGYYDIIYFIVHEQVYDSSGSGFSTLSSTYTRYYYFISDRYYNKLILYREMDILSYIKLNNEIGEKTYNYLFDRLLNIDDNLYYYIKDKANIDNDILDTLEDIDNDMQFNLDIITDLLNKILNALLNLNIELPEADFTDILSKLDTIIDNQDTSDINDDWYKNYREWLYGINENDSYLSPHEYFNYIFGTLKTTFDSFTNNISFNAYLLKVEDFINHISGSTTDNLTIYLRDGIGDPGFNINNNYMYTVEGSQ